MRARCAGGGLVAPVESGGWRLSIPSGAAKPYRLAQLDDYAGLRRSRFLWRPPLRLSLRARVSTDAVQGTWGFGLWNDPFAVGIGLGGSQARVPTLPNCAWFFHASPPNYLSFRDGQPASGFLAATFASRASPASLFTVGMAAVPALASSWGGRLLRARLRRLVAQDAASVGVDAADWHEYSLRWRADAVAFEVDGRLALTTAISPCGPLALVLWIDNQYAALPPSGRLHFGSLPLPRPTELHLADVTVQVT